MPLAADRAVMAPCVREFSFEPRGPFPVLGPVFAAGTHLPHHQALVRLHEVRDRAHVLVAVLALHAGSSSWRPRAACSPAKNETRNATSAAYTNAIGSARTAPNAVTARSAVTAAAPEIALSTATSFQSPFA